MIQAASSMNVKDARTGALLVSMRFSEPDGAVDYLSTAELVCSVLRKTLQWKIDDHGHESGLMVGANAAPIHVNERPRPANNRRDKAPHHLLSIRRGYFLTVGYSIPNRRLHE